MQFLEFIDRKQRESKKHLKLIEKLLLKNGMEVYSHIEKDEDPHIFVKTKKDNISFGGIRIYEIADMIAYRIQKNEDTEPYGQSYILDLEDMFNDYMSENMKEKEAGKLVINSVCTEIKKFFDKSAEAEIENKDKELEFGSNRGIIRASKDAF